MVTEKGYGKRVPIDEFRQQKRNGKGSTAIKFKQKAGGGGIESRKAGKVAEDPDALSCMRICRPGDELVLSTERGNIIRQRVDDLSIQSRTATGVLIQKLDKDDVIVMVDILPPQTGDTTASQPTPETIAIIDNNPKEKSKKPTVAA